MEAMGSVNIWATLVAAVSAFVLGGVWYAKPVFGTAWMRASGLTEEALQGNHPAKVFGLSFVLSFLAAWLFGMFLGPDPALGFAVGVGFAAGLVWVAGAFGINYLFENKPLSLWLINGGYHTAQFTLYGLAFGAI